MIVQEYTSKTQVLQMNRFSQTEKTRATVVCVHPSE